VTFVKNLTIALENRPGALAEMGEALGRGGISIEGGGVFTLNNVAVANFLFSRDAPVRRVLESAGIRVLHEREVLVQRLCQGEPGQLGKIARQMAEAGVNIEVQYSDHDNQLILVVDNIEAGRLLSEQWKQRHTNSAQSEICDEREET
jgi:hypothetical protein